MGKGAFSLGVIELAVYQRGNALTKMSHVRLPPHG
jgi:hypothetical protein